MKDLILNTAINHLKKSPLLQGAVSIANNYMDKLNENFVHEAVELDQLLAKLSPATDDLIIGFERNDGLTFIGGDLTVTLAHQETENFSIQLKLYLKDKKDKVILKEINKFLELKLLTTKSINELKSKNQIEFEVNAPDTSKK